MSYKKTQSFSVKIRKTGGSQAINQATPTTITFQTTDWDEYQLADISNSRITFTKSGVVIVSAEVSWAASATAGLRNCGINLFNSSDVLLHSASNSAFANSASNSCVVNATTVFSVSPGDYITVTGYQNVAASLDAQNGSMLSLVIIK